MFGNDIFTKGLLKESNISPSDGGFLQSSDIPGIASTALHI